MTKAINLKIFTAHSFQLLKESDNLQRSFNEWVESKKKDIEIIRSDYHCIDKKNKNGQAFRETQLLIFYLEK